MSSESTATEEALMWKHDLFSLAMQRMSGCAIWGNTLFGNCLPASLCILDDAKVRHPGAFVVIGDICKNGEEPVAAVLLQNFISDHCSSKPPFHAWIDLGCGDIFDVVGPSWIGSSGTYYDAELASKEGFRYYNVLVDEVDVKAFYSKLLALQLGA